MTIQIRHAEPADAEAIARIFSAPRAAWGTLQLPYASIESYRKRLTDRPEGQYQLVALIEGVVIGSASVYTNPNARQRHAGGIGMAVRDDHHSKGVGSALLRELLELADNWLNLRRVELDVYVDNAPAIALYRKFGFEQEGVKRDFAYRGGQFVDALFMSRLRR
jgi:L-phenylalanine/L-methionine N-acetyltransferase